MSCTRPHTLVTGASSGIGRATAVRMAALGHHVFAGVRDLGDGPRAEAGEITPITLDVTRPEQITAAVEQLDAHVGAAGLTGLVNNAGVGVAWPLELVPLDLVRHQFEVNVFGQLAVTQALLPLLRKARGRVVMIGSIGDRLTMPFGAPLCSSKAAVASLTEGLRQEVAPWDIRVVLVEPASIHTEAVDKLERDAKQAVTQFPAAGRELYQGAYENMVHASVSREKQGSSPDVVARTVATALTTARPKARYLTGKHSLLLATLAAYAPVPVFDALRRKIFRLPAPGSLATRGAA